MKSHFFKGFIMILMAQLTMSCEHSEGKSVPDQNQHSRQTQPVGGGCETCEIMYIDMPAELNSIDTSIAWNKAGQKLVIHGKVFRKDGITPASDVILYYWHTDNTGRYTSAENMNPKAARHGSIRGWVKTNADGEYTLYTIRPAAYPGGSEPEHIHFLVKEPDIANEYYIDDIVFADDPLLKKSIERRTMNNRGGSGIVNIKNDGALQITEHKVVLGLNIPGYK